MRPSLADSLLRRLGEVLLRLLWLLGWEKEWERVGKWEEEEEEEEGGPRRGVWGGEW